MPWPPADTTNIVGDLDLTGVLKIDGTTVLTGRQAAIANNDPTGDLANNILVALRFANIIAP